MNDKKLNRILDLVHNEYPFLVGIEYGKNYIYGSCSFTFEVDHDEFQSLYPRGIIDWEYINGEYSGLKNVMMGFMEYGTTDSMRVRGLHILKYIKAIVVPFVSYELSENITILFKF